MKIVVILSGGETCDVTAKAGSTLMEATRATGLPVRVECGGAMACATCHIEVDPEWIGEVGRAGDEEANLLENSNYNTDNSCLSCQIIAKDALDGLRVTLQQDTFEG